jgi:hypothetical protein
LAENLGDHSETCVAGFVVNSKPNLKSDVEDRRKELEELHDVVIHVFSFEQWVTQMRNRADDVSEDVIAKQWIIAFVESICQKRRTEAPIDEPCDVWVAELGTLLSAWSP